MIIKHFLFALLLATGLCSPAQAQSFPEVDLNYESQFFFEEVIFRAGDTSFFTQRCTDKLPAELVNHTVQMNHFHVKKIPFRFVVTFKDTVVQQTLYFYEGKEIDSALAILGLNRNAFYRLDDDSPWFYTAKDELRTISCWIDRKRLFYTEIITR